jgi:hypothetical protein
MTTTWGTPAYERAKRWLDNLIEVDFSALREKTESLSSYVSLPQVIPITESRLSAFGEGYPVEDMKRRRLRRRPLQMMGVRFDDKIDAWILPIRDPDTKELRGWQVKAGDWVRNHPTGVQKGRTLFGLDMVETDWVVVVESPLDVVRLYQLGIPAVATFGSKWTEEQFNILRRFRCVVLAFDNDESGHKAVVGKAKKPGLRDRLSEAGVIVKCVQWQYYEECGKDLGEFEFAEDIQGAIDTALTPQAEAMLRVMERLS